MFTIRPDRSDTRRAFLKVGALGRAGGGFRMGQTIGKSDAWRADRPRPR